MANKFKCRDCRHSFMLNAGSDLVCPKCKSDNIEPLKGSNVVWKLLLFVVMAVVGFFATEILVFKSEEIAIKPVQPQEITSFDDELEEPVKPDYDAPVAELEEEPKDLPVVVEELLPIDNAVFSVSNKTLNQSGFSFIACCENIPVDYQIEQYMLFLNENDAEPVLRAEANGKFSSDKYFAPDGKYFIKATFINGNCTTLKSIDGIVKPEEKKEEVQPSRMEQSELQSKIDASVLERNGNSPVNKWYRGVSGDARISTKVKITVSGMEKPFIGVAAMLQHGRAKKLKIKVLSVSYDKNNVIDAFEISTSE